MTDALKVTEVDIEAAIAYEYYVFGSQFIDYTVPVLGPAWDDIAPGPEMRRLTICVLILKNGFLITGESACVSSENFDEATGRKYARQCAIAKMWPLLGYALKEKLMEPTARHTLRCD